MPSITVTVNLDEFTDGNIIEAARDIVGDSFFPLPPEQEAWLRMLLRRESDTARAKGDIKAAMLADDILRNLITNHSV